VNNEYLHDHLPPPVKLIGQPQIVLTPTKLVKWILDQYPTEVWKNSTKNWLIPVGKHGVFEIEIFNRLMMGLANEFPSPEARRLHIVSNMIFSICPTDACNIITRRLYLGEVWDDLAGFMDVEGNVETLDFLKASIDKDGRIMVKRGKAKKSEYMKFDYVVGNPPYQENNGSAGKGSRATSIYQKYVLKAMDLNPRFISMIIPGRWMTGNGSGVGLTQLLEKMINSNKLAKITTEKKDERWFPAGVSIRGEAMFFLYDGKKTTSVVDINGISVDLKGQEVILTDPCALSIKNKIASKAKIFFSDKDLGQKPYGILSNHRVGWMRTDQMLDGESVWCYTLENKRPVKKPISINEISKNKDSVCLYKTCITKASGSGADGTSSPFVAKPGEIVSETYRVLSVFDNEQEANNCRDFIRTPFSQYLISLLKVTQNISSKTLGILPVLDFSRSYSNQDLYKMFNLSEEEITHIETFTQNFPAVRTKVIETLKKKAVKTK
jgi:site-specific DNA-methyltransferase (adenine-specific)